MQRHACAAVTPTLLRNTTGRLVGRTSTAAATASSSTSTTVVAPLLQTSHRYQSSDQYHNFLKSNRVVQSEGTDPFHRVKQDQQMYNNTEQWEGYSQAYLKRWMQYTPTNQRQDVLEHKNKDINEILALVWKHYGEAADVLEILEDDLLHPQFHAFMEKAKVGLKDLESSIDSIYADAHPTIKTVIDAWMVRRLYALTDWIALLEKRRAQLIQDLSPEYIELQSKLKAVAERHIWRLQKLGQALTDNPAMFLEGSDFTSRGLSEYEMASIKQRMTYFKKFERFSQAINIGELQPH